MAYSLLLVERSCSTGQIRAYFAKGTSKSTNLANPHQFFLKNVTLRSTVNTVGYKLATEFNPKFTNCVTFFVLLQLAAITEETCCYSYKLQCTVLLAEQQAANYTIYITLVSVTAPLLPFPLVFIDTQLRYTFNIHFVTHLLHSSNTLF